MLNSDQGKLVSMALVMRIWQRRHFELTELHIRLER